MHRLQRFASRRNLSSLVPEYSLWRFSLKVGLVGLGVLSIVIALARPRWGFEWKEVKRKGVDIMIALDVSKSMGAQDIPPNRLSRAQREIIDLIRMLQGDRIGLIAFAGVGFVQCPLTTDYGAVKMFLSHIDDDFIPIPGTSLGDAIRLGVKSLTESSELHSAGKAIILITDGEDHESKPLEAADEALKAGVKIFTIGMGKQGGAPIPNERGGFKKDRSGNLILSKLDEGTLQKIAGVTGGRYVRSTSGDLDLERIYLDGIKGGDLKEGEIKASREKLWYDRSHLFSLIGFILLYLSFWVRETVPPAAERQVSSS